MKKQGKKFKGKVSGLTPAQRIGMNATAAPELWAYAIKAAACGASVAAVDDRLAMAIPMTKAVQALEACRATREDWARVSKVAYALIHLRRQGVISKHSAESLELISQAIDAALKRQAQTRSNVLTPAEIQALDVLNAAWVDAIEATEISKLVDASEYATRRLAQEYRTAGNPKALALEVCAA